MYTFVVVRDNSVEDCKSFIDYWAAEDYANDFIQKIDHEIGPIDFRKGVFYQQRGLSVGVYHSPVYNNTLKSFCEYSL
jgi:hypothetical protein